MIREKANIDYFPIGVCYGFYNNRIVMRALFVRHLYDFPFIYYYYYYHYIFPILINFIIIDFRLYLNIRLFIENILLYFFHKFYKIFINFSLLLLIVL